jgi:hypothetical protein
LEIGDWPQQNKEMTDDSVELSEEQPRPSFSRREFLRGLALFVAGSALSACGAPRVEPQGLVTPWNTPTPIKVLQSPQPPATAEATATLSPDGLQLEEFLALSAVLTGIENLDPVLGHVYLQSLQASSDFEVSLAELYERAGFRAAGPPTDVEALANAGTFAAETTQKLADKIIEYWYTGVYDTAGGEQAVATFVDALAWKALHYTKPPTICASPGFWAERPD